MAARSSSDLVEDCSVEPEIKPDLNARQLYREPTIEKDHKLEGQVELGASYEKLADSSPTVKLLTNVSSEPQRYESDVEHLRTDTQCVSGIQLENRGGDHPLRTAREQHASPVKISKTTQHRLDSAGITSTLPASVGHISSCKTGNTIPRKSIPIASARLNRGLVYELESQGGGTVSRGVDKDLPQTPQKFGYNPNWPKSGARKASVKVNKRVDTETSNAIPKTPDSPNSIKLTTPMRREFLGVGGATVRFAIDAPELLGPEALEEEHALGSTPPENNRTQITARGHETNIQLTNTKYTPNDGQQIEPTHNADGESNHSLAKNTTKIPKLKQSHSFQARSSSLRFSPTGVNSANSVLKYGGENVRTAKLESSLPRPTPTGTKGVGEPPFAARDIPQSQTGSRSNYMNRFVAPMHKTTSSTSLQKATRGLKSRITSMIPRFRRNAKSVVAIQSAGDGNTRKNITIIRKEDRAFAESTPTVINSGGSDTDDSFNDGGPKQIRPSRVPTPSENSRNIHQHIGIKNDEDRAFAQRNPTILIGDSSSYDDSVGVDYNNYVRDNLREENIEKVASNKGDKQDVEPEQTVSAAHNEPKQDKGKTKANHTVEVNPLDGEKSPAVPPRSLLEILGHYTKHGIIPEQNQLDESGIGEYVDELLRIAERNYIEVYQSSLVGNNSDIQLAIQNLVAPIGNAIHATRQARIATIALHSANAGIAKHVASLSTYAGTLSLHPQQPT